MTWRARIDSITADHIAAVRRTRDDIDEVDARARAAIERIGETVAGDVETPQERAAREAREERDRLVREEVERAALAKTRDRDAHRRRGDDAVLPTDWTDEDEARAEGYGPPKSWLA